MNNIEEFRIKASQESMGASGDEIKDYLLKEISLYANAETNASFIDVGCGTGDLLNRVAKTYPNFKLQGIDLQDFNPNDKERKWKIVEQDLNRNFSTTLDKFDFVVSSEVIEHLENPRAYIRELSNLLKENGKLIITTPNLESWTSIISFIVRGYHSAFGGKSYPAHITPVAVYDLKNIINETGGLKVKNIRFINNGRMPGANLKWHTLFPFLRGKRFSDNYLITIETR
jgi:2-polyprenyl-3-methyl-5-hydroxy-6-metoxy-1,4-benzoquinol methylase